MTPQTVRRFLTSTLLAASFFTSAATQAQSVSAFDQEAFVTAAMQGNKDAIQKTLSVFARDEETLEKALSLACLRGHKDVVAIILADKDIVLDLKKPHVRYLAYAARGGHEDVMHMLFLAGMHDESGFALASAIDAGNKISFDYLLDKAGIDANAGNGMVMSVAMTADDAYYVRRLLEKGAHVERFPIIRETLENLRKDMAQGKGNTATPAIITLIEDAVQKSRIAHKRKTMTSQIS